MIPRGLLGAGLVFWGWQTGNVPVSVALALVVEAPRWTAVRFELRPIDLTRIADLCTAVFIGVLVVVAASRGFREGVLAALMWLPAVLAPIVLAQRLTGAGRIPLSALFQYLRRRKRRDPSTEDPLVDPGGAYLAVCVVAAGVGNLRTPGYYVGLILLAGWTLHAIRPRHARVFQWLGALAVAGAAGFAGQAGLAQLQGSLEDWYSDWNLRGMDADPYRSTTDIGSIGRLKLHDAIVLRVYAEPRDASRPRLLHRASFTTYAGTTWHARKAPMTPVPALADGATWVLGGGAGNASVRIVTRLENGKALLALPGDTLRILGLPADQVRRNALGAVRADVGGDWTSYVAVRRSGFSATSPPGEDDLDVPAAERAAIRALAETLDLGSVPPGEALRRVQRHFGAFGYSTYRESAPPPGATALADFLQRSKSGHCEYFAAATTLLLRAAGIPARYATGFALLEYSEIEGAYVARARHAHAWTRAWVDGRWQDVDTTPPAWFAEEARLAPAWERLADLVRWATYRWAQRTGFEPGARWYAVLALLGIALGWRVLRGKRAARLDRKDRAEVARPRPGLDSGFYAVERVLAACGCRRAPGESLGTWAVRAARAIDEAQHETLREVLRLHCRYRFDPAGLGDGDRLALEGGVQRLLAALGNAVRADPSRPRMDMKQLS